MNDIKLPSSKEDVIKTYGDNTTSIPKRCQPKHVEWLKEIKKIKEEIKPLEERKKFLENQMAIFMLNHEILVDNDGVVIATWKYDAKGGFASAQFKKDYPALYENYCTQKTRRFLIKG